MTHEKQSAMDRTGELNADERTTSLLNHMLDASGDKRGDDVPIAWRINYKSPDGFCHTALHGHNAIADYRMVDAGAIPTALYTEGQLNDARAAVMADTDAWQALFSKVSKSLNCLPSMFVDANTHVIKAAEQAAKNKADAERWRAFASSMADTSHADHFLNALMNIIPKDKEEFTVEELGVWFDSAIAAGGSK